MSATNAGGPDDRAPERDDHVSLPMAYPTHSPASPAPSMFGATGEHSEGAAARLTSQDVALTAALLDFAATSDFARGGAVHEDILAQQFARRAPVNMWDEDDDRIRRVERAIARAISIGVLEYAGEPQRLRRTGQSAA